MPKRSTVPAATTPLRLGDPGFLQAFQKAAPSLSGDPETARRRALDFLQRAGVVDEDGKLSKPYRS
ncbi:MAG: hypothetical protein PW843_00965 [Azospirillaceae bacterium]|nr:hypothetical protein [Azospirillaceae bacterium]